MDYRGFSIPLDPHALISHCELLMMHALVIATTLPHMPHGDQGQMRVMIAKDVLHKLKRTNTETESSFHISLDLFRGTSNPYGGCC